MKLKLKKLFRIKQKDPHCSVVVVAAGSSERMGGDKMLMTLGTKPVIIRTLMAFQQCPMVDDIVVVTRREKIMALADMIKLYDISKVSQVISGGATRAEASLAGVSAVRKGAKLIAIHDGARPLVSRENFGRYKTQRLIDKLYAGSAKAMVAALVERQALKREDVGELRAMFDALWEEKGGGET